MAKDTKNHKESFMQDQSRKLSIREKIAYGLGDS